MRKFASWLKRKIKFRIWWEWRDIGIGVRVFTTLYTEHNYAVSLQLLTVEVVMYFGER